MQEAPSTGLRSSWTRRRSTSRAARRLIVGLAVAGAAAVGFWSAPARAAGETAIQPGSQVTNATLAQQILNQDTSTGSGAFAVAAVGPYQGDNAVRLLATALHCDAGSRAQGECGAIGPTSAFARGSLSYGFCVPVSGSTTCGRGTGPAETIAVNVSFDHSYDGRLEADTPVAQASFAASAQLRDETANQVLNFQNLLQQSVSGSVKAIKGVPFPIPGTTGVVQTQRVTFQATIVRGDVIRFTAFAAARAESGRVGTAGGARSVFTSGYFPGLDGYFSVSNLDVSVLPAGTPPSGPVPPAVTQAIADLAARLDSIFGDLESRLADLGVQLSSGIEELQATTAALQSTIEALDARVRAQDAEIKALQQAVADLQHRVAGSPPTGGGTSGQHPGSGSSGASAPHAGSPGGDTTTTEETHTVPDPPQPAPHGSDQGGGSSTGHHGTGAHG